MFPAKMLKHASTSRNVGFTMKKHIFNHARFYRTEDAKQIWVNAIIIMIDVRKENFVSIPKFRIVTFSISKMK